MRIPSPMGSGPELQQSDGWNLERLELCAFAHGRKDKAKAAEEQGRKERKCRAVGALFCQMEDFDYFCGKISFCPNRGEG